MDRQPRPDLVESVARYVRTRSDGDRMLRRNRWVLVRRPPWRAEDGPGTDYAGAWGFGEHDALPHADMGFYGLPNVDLVKVIAAPEDEVASVFVEYTERPAPTLRFDVPQGGQRSAGPIRLALGPLQAEPTAELPERHLMRLEMSGFAGHVAATPSSSDHDGRNVVTWPRVVHKDGSLMLEFRSQPKGRHVTLTLGRQGYAEIAGLPLDPEPRPFRELPPAQPDLAPAPPMSAPVELMQMCSADEQGVTCWKPSGEPTDTLVHELSAHLNLHGLAINRWGFRRRYAVVRFHDFGGPWGRRRVTVWSSAALSMQSTPSQIGLQYGGDGVMAVALDFFERAPVVADIQVRWSERPVVLATLPLAQGLGVADADASLLMGTPSPVAGKGTVVPYELVGDSSQWSLELLVEGKPLRFVDAQGRGTSDPAPGLTPYWEWAKQFEIEGLAWAVPEDLARYRLQVSRTTTRTFTFPRTRVQPVAG